MIWTACKRTHNQYETNCGFRSHPRECLYTNGIRSLIIGQITNSNMSVMKSYQQARNYCQHGLLKTIYYCLLELTTYRLVTFFTSRNNWICTPVVVKYSSNILRQHYHRSGLYSPHPMLTQPTLTQPTSHAYTTHILFLHSPHPTLTQPMLTQSMPTQPTSHAYTAHTLLVLGNSL